MTNNPAPVEQRHRDAWEIYGPRIFYEGISGPEALARFERAHCTRADALREAVSEALRQIEKYAEFFCEEDFDPTVDMLRAALSDSPQAAPDEVVERLRRIAKGWADWYRFATRDDDNEYLNDKGWDDAEALADMTMTALAAMGDQP